MLYDRTILGYHGCDEITARRVLSGRPFAPSTNDYDWLGRGVYFWEYGPDRAYRWAREKIERRLASPNHPVLSPNERKPAVVGAVIQLGTCFDLCEMRFTEELRETYNGVHQASVDAGAPLPRNQGRDNDLKLRRLDCYVINTHMDLAEAYGDAVYDTVRGVFVEGPPVFPGAMIRHGTHVQVSVRNPACIVGIFRPRIIPR